MKKKFFKMWSHPKKYCKETPMCTVQFTDKDFKMALYLNAQSNFGPTLIDSSIKMSNPSYKV